MINPRTVTLAALLSISPPTLAGTPVLYGVNYVNDPGTGALVYAELVTVNPDSGFISVIGELPTAAVGEIAVSPDGRVFSVSADTVTFTNPGVLYEIDVASGEGLPAGFPLLVRQVGTDTGINIPVGLDFDSRGFLFGARDNFDGTADLVQYDLTTGAGSVIGPIGFNPAGDFALVPGAMSDTLLMSSFDVFADATGRLPELVTNGSFEADGAGASTLVDPVTGWSCVGTTGATSTFVPTLAGRAAYLAMSGSAGVTFCFQDVAVTPGNDYTLSFDYSSDGSGDTGFSAQCDGVVQFSQTDEPFNPGWSSFDGSARFEETCTASTGTIRISLTASGSGFVGVDDVSLKQKLAGALVEVDTTTGAGALIGEFGTFDQAFAMEYFQGRLVAADNEDGSAIYEVDPATAAPTLLSNPAQTVSIGDFAGFEPFEPAYEYALDELSVQGAGVDGFFDDFNDGIFQGCAPYCAGAQVTEEGGYLLLTDADGSFPLGPPFTQGTRGDSVLLALPPTGMIADESSGILTMTAKFRNDLDTFVDEPFGSLFQISFLGVALDGFTADETTALSVVKAVDGSVKIYFTDVAALQAANQEAALATAAGFDTIPSATGAVVLELVLDQATNQVTPRYSVDGGTNFVEYADWENNAGGLLTFDFSAPGGSFPFVSGLGRPGVAVDPPVDNVEQVPLPLAALGVLAAALLGCRRAYTWNRRQA